MYLTGLAPKLERCAVRSKAATWDASMIVASRGKFQFPPYWNLFFCMFIMNYTPGAPHRKIVSMVYPAPPRYWYFLHQQRWLPRPQIVFREFRVEVKESIAAFKFYRLHYLPLRLKFLPAFSALQIFHYVYNSFNLATFSLGITRAVIVCVLEAVFRPRVWVNRCSNWGVVGRWTTTDRAYRTWTVWCHSHYRETQTLL